ncbi:TetR/AcrR family transcriptional regulator [Aquabacterium sp. A7-Y]|uniref:TetR/AcrR family transcriptional regulator n=1 Tax=Aquabacterium sp. A7-Y TaxID=1349605 RepID=UPI00223CD2B4|nr:TetR/AcrR family transcriptional regulator [Aquabacterium sp. A7-Y]MCW7539466.1 TetR/AcrR family transcriptional regulator [Aquabacterium sp. A7-Y]
MRSLLKLRRTTPFIFHPMARTKDEQLHQQRRRSILSAAARVFKAKGFHLARTEDICTEAGMSAGTVFRYFTTKQEMIAAIAQLEFDSYKADLEFLASKAGLEWLSQLTDTDFEELLRPTEFDLGADSWLELARDPVGRARILELDRQSRTTLTQELRRGQEAGWVRPGLDCAGASHLLLSIISGLQFEAEIGVRLDAASTAKALADLVGSYFLKKE